MEITVQNSKDILDEINERLWDIPFDNSYFQNKNFVINSSLTPERAYRAAALRLQDRLGALKNAKFQAMKDDVKKRQLEYKIGIEDDCFKKELLEIKLEELKSNEPYKAKLINDAINEANQLYVFIQSQPKYTREEFENAEKNHFEQRLIQEASGVTGALKSLADMGIDIEQLSRGNLKYKGEEDAIQLR